MAEAADQASSRIQDTAFKIFAFIGFLSSIVTIIAWFGSSSSSLTTTVTKTTIEVPKALQLTQYSSVNYSLENVLEDAQAKYCNPVDVGYNGTKSKNYYFNQATCDTQKGFFQTIKSIAALDGKPLIAYDLKLANDGTTVAQNIKIRSPIDVQADATDQNGDPVKVNAQQPSRVFVLPDLNPNEEVKIRLVSATAVKDNF